ncbi:hypothetical protein J7I98_40365 [Streptomyces sp. ISL-98]|uniref:hypothetical protein n=1 Tax=Streptomyces sp. ISL-98 TaxID=2819192 RepID=UPI001BEAE640|nr:hypothetical protein [Streptomyces sp. ISL-98]MBT2511895.1 hypothetical protein [Streptomyces sp. ISL-98]
MFTNLVTPIGLACLAWAVVYVARIAWRNRQAKAGIDAAAYGLVPRSELDPHRPGPPRDEPGLRVAVEAACDGKWEPVAALLASAGEDWELRWRLVSVFADVAVEDERWLRIWRAEQPRDADAVVVHAHALVLRAWEARGANYAHQTSDEQMALFSELLPTAMYAAQEAARLAPRDPSPWITMVAAARGLGLSHDEFRQLWAELTARAPHHYEAHWQALQYWCQKWYGSHKLMFKFAREAMEAAPAGSLLSGMYLHAVYEAVRQDGDEAYRTWATKRVLTRVEADIAQAAPDHRRLPEIRHLLAAVLVKTGRYKEALAQFRLLGGWCGAEPWNDQQDAALAFDQARGLAALGAGRRP